MSYPEKIWQYKKGMSSKGKSGLAFSESLQDIFKSNQLLKPGSDVDLIYSLVRSGMYHNAGTAPRVQLSEQFEHALAVENGNVWVNPHRLPGAFSDHFSRYVAELRVQTNTDLRAKFETMFGQV
jgi:hypothetical protein